MKVAIIGGGFTGLSAAYRLLQKNHQVTIIEKDNNLGGLAIGFTNPDWDWTLEKAYHHWFTNDYSALKLAAELNFPVITKRPKTDVYIQGKIASLDSPLSLLKFGYLPLTDRLRTGIILTYLKILQNYQKLENKTALSWLRKTMGENVTNLIWEPLLQGKFGSFKDQIALNWFWARIKKRTEKLAYPKGGFQKFANTLGSEVKKLGGLIILNAVVTKIKSKDKTVTITSGKKIYKFDKVIVTLPSPIFTKITPDLPKDYTAKINSIPHLHAQVMILTFKKPFLKDTYWLSITDKTFPFLVLAEHTNFMDSKNYGNQHILYIGNYLPPEHRLLKMNKTQLLKHFSPFLKKINYNFRKILIDNYLFIGPYAQPVVTTDYPKDILNFQTPLKNIYLANLDMVYPWDRGTNYAIEMGEKIAQKIISENV